MDCEGTGKRLKLVRELLNQSQIEFATAHNIPLKMIQSLEEGQIPPSVELLTSLSKDSININWLL